jgi:hypothetical protein
MSAAWIACGGRDDPPAGHANFALARFDTIVRADNASIGEVADLGIAPDSTIWLLDRTNGRVVTLRPNGDRVSIFGNAGRGPGELLRAEAMIVASSLALILDPGNARVQYYDHAGAAAGHFGISRSVLVPAALNARGDIASPTLGLDSALVVVLEGRARTLRRVGRPVADPPSVIDLSGLREQALRGEIPREFRNNVLPVLGDNGACLLVLQALGELQYFDSGGRQVWSRMLPDSVVSLARKEYLASASRDTDPGRVPQPRVAAAGRLVNGQAWLMLSPGTNGKNSLLVLVANSGEVQMEIMLNVTGAGAFAIDAARKRLYIVLPGDGLVLAGSLEGIL